MTGGRGDGTGKYEFIFNFPILSDGSKTISARSASNGMQDGIDLINALAGNPNTARGGVRGGIYGTAPSLNPDASNPTLENSGGDVRFENDFRSVYAQAIDNWLGGDSAAVLGGNYKKSSLGFV